MKKEMTIRRSEGGRQYQKPEIWTIEISSQSCILALSDLENSAIIGGDTDPDDPDPWI